MTIAMTRRMMQPPTTPPTMEVVAGPELSDLGSSSWSESDLSEPASAACVGSALVEGAALMEMVSIAPVAVVTALGTGVEIEVEDYCLNGSIGELLLVLASDIAGDGLDDIAGLALGTAHGSGLSSEEPT
ncbi:hypothetical protein HG530_003208 [Fusarium avenaceum]|nr:hypothetical protein HG530_003208 [Fusarium avenaceum]